MASLFSSIVRSGQKMRSYFNDAYVREFTTNVLREETLAEGRRGVVLEETYFYPTSGGQPNDLGSISGIEVLDVIDGEEILHVINQPLEMVEVVGRIDWQRRFDHMQQHAGQHLLSAIFEKLYAAETVGFHLGDEYVTVDLALEELTIEMVREIELAVNELIYQNLPIRAYFVEPEKIQELPLRKQPVVKEEIRIVEIEGIDYSPCGGTHPHSTGEIGLIKICRWEKKRDNIRVEFVCGHRALIDYHWKNEQIKQIALHLSCKDSQSLENFERLSAEAKELRKKVGYLKEQVQRYEADEYYTNSQEVKGVHLVTQIFTDREMKEAKRLANKIISKEKVIVLFAIKSEKAQVSFSCSKDLQVNMNDLLKEVIGLIDGSGGGTAQSAQGGGTNLSNLESLLQAAEMILKKRLL